jgi:hypothetical protein
VEEIMSEIEKKIEELLHSNSYQEKIPIMTTTSKTSEI